MFWLFLLAVILVIILFTRSDKRKQSETDQQLAARNEQWAQFIASYALVAKSAKERALLQRMLDDIAAQNLAGQRQLAAQEAHLEEAYPETQDDTSKQQVQQPVTQTTPVQAAQPAAASTTTNYTMPEIQMDNASLLLYFGAFLFVAAVGLFIAFGGADGSVRTLLVFLLAAVFYAGGIWVYKTKPKLEQAGVAFVSIGIVIAPLVGAAAYLYIFDKANGPTIWLITSVACMALYVHALKVLRNPIISYLLIFTFLSLFESGVSIINAPIYYYGWALAAVGIILQVTNRYFSLWPELKEPTAVSAQVFLPVALISSVIMAGNNGVTQVGVSFIFATAFYGLMALDGTEEEKEINTGLAQISANVAVATLTYGLTESIKQTAVSLIVFAILQGLVVLVNKNKTGLIYNFATITILGSVASIGASINYSNILLIAVAAGALISFAIYLKQARGDAYGLSSLALISLPYIYGQLYAAPSLKAAPQALIGLGVLLALLAGYVLIARRAPDEQIKQFAQGSFIIAATTVIIGSLFAGPILVLAVSIASLLCFVVIAETEKTYIWADGASIFLLVAMARAWPDKSAFLIATASSLAILIIMALRYRREFLRWVGTFVWLALPIAMGQAAVWGSWGNQAYAWAYVVATIGLIIARSIARGVIFFSSKIPLMAYARNQSLSYVIGYSTAAAASVVISLNSKHSQTDTTIILVIMMCLSWILSKVVEKRVDILAIEPILAQLALLSLIRPEVAGAKLTLWILSSSSLAVVSYLISLYAEKSDSNDHDIIYSVEASILSAFLAPAAYFFTDHHLWSVALSLFVAGALCLHFTLDKRQSDREWAGAVIALSAMLFLQSFGIEELQAYVHVVIATLGIYAYWRAIRGEQKESENYIWATLIAATVPLALQALSGKSGGLYGWWLLIEQVVIMLIGMALGKGFVTRWGLFVATGAVLYQLRNLGYLALGVLALVLIGIAVYSLQKHSDK